MSGYPIRVSGRVSATIRLEAIRLFLKFSFKSHLKSLDRSIKHLQLSLGKNLKSSVLVRRKNLTLIFNEYLYLASGNPQPKILWTSQETQEIISKSNKLYFEAVSPSDTGSYICVASNDAGERYLEISIVVQLPPQECRQKLFFGSQS